MTEQLLIHKTSTLNDARRWEIASGNRSVAKNINLRWEDSIVRRRRKRVKHKKLISSGMKFASGNPCLRT